MKSSFRNGEEFFHRLYTLFNATIAASLLPMGWLLVLLQSGQLKKLDLSSSVYLVIGAVLVCSLALMISARLNLTRSLKSQFNPEQTLREKLTAYKKLNTIMYVRFLLAELLIVVAFYATGQKIFIVGYIIGLILLSIKRPTLSAFIDDLQLKGEEKTILLEKQDIP